MKKLKLIVMAVVLISVIGILIYIVMGNKNEKEIADNGSKEVVQGNETENISLNEVNLTTPFY